MEINEPIENYKTGFIAIYRSLKKHWIWNDPIKFKWWIDILLSVNYEDKKVNIGFQLFDCKRGQTVKSLMTWGKEWNVDKKTVHRFFELLKNDSMIVTENLQKTTRLTVCNYDSYQVNGHDKEPQRKRKGNAKETQGDTNNKDNNINNVNNIYSLYPTKCPIGNRSTGKCNKDKIKISKLIKEGKDLKTIIETYLSDCVKTKTYIKNFGTFLNQLPDFSETSSELKKIKKFRVKHPMGESRVYEVETLQKAKELYQQNTGVLNIEEIYQVNGN